MYVYVGRRLRFLRCVQVQLFARHWRREATRESICVAASSLMSVRCVSDFTVTSVFFLTMRNVSKPVFVVPVQVLKKIAKYIQEQNDKIYAPRGLLLTDPIERGLRVVSYCSVPGTTGKHCLFSSLRLNCRALFNCKQTENNDPLNRLISDIYLTLYFMGNTMKTIARVNLRLRLPAKQTNQKRSQCFHNKKKTILLHKNEHVWDRGMIC